MTWGLSLSRGVLFPAGSLSGGSLSRGISVWGVSVQASLCSGGLCPGWSLSRRCLCPRGSQSRRGVSVWGVSVQGDLSPEGGLCLGGLCPGGSQFMREGVSVWGVVSVRETPRTKTPPPPYGNERAVRILLECILVWVLLTKLIYEFVWRPNGVTKELRAIRGFFCDKKFYKFLRIWQIKITTFSVFLIYNSESFRYRSKLHNNMWISVMKQESHFSRNVLIDMCLPDLEELKRCL